jgi:hypothetical protein
MDGEGIEMRMKTDSSINLMRSGMTDEVLASASALGVLGSGFRLARFVNQERR